MPSQRELFLRHLAQTSPAPLALEIERAEGCFLYTTSGKAYVDLISGISVSSVGHRHPLVLKAIQEQLEKYMHLMVYGEYIQTPQVQLARRLAGLLPDPLNSVYFVNSGAEAIDGALKLAKRVTGRTELISFHNAYHGSTHGPLSIMGSETFKTAYRPLLTDTRLLHYDVIEELEQITTRTACVVVELVQGEGGALPASQEFVKAIRKRCAEVGALLIVDEIQTGFGRTGKLFAMEHHQLVPDIVCLAKGMGGGLPIGAFVAAPELMQQFAENPVLGHITTFGGNAVCCAASLGMLDALEKENAVAGVAEREMIIRNTLQHPTIRELRGKGLLYAALFESFDVNKSVIDACMKKGIITDWFLFCDSGLRIAPPLNIPLDILQKACTSIVEILDEL